MDFSPSSPAKSLKKKDSAIKNLSASRTRYYLCAPKMEFL
jgi:hypothetical protein